MSFPGTPCRSSAFARRLAFFVASLLLCHTAPNLRADRVLRSMTSLELERQISADLACTRQLAQIMRAARVWSMDNADQPPPCLQVLTNELESPVVLCCPAVFHDSIPTNWAAMDWSKIDYKWVAGVDWNNPTNVACLCVAHNDTAQVDGTVHGGGYRTGWPLLIATPNDVYATPGEAAAFELSLAPDILQPVAFQWRKSSLYFATNVISVRDIENPSTFRWFTNVLPVFDGTNLPGQTNASLRLTALRTNDAGFYSVAISNSLGVSLSRQVLLDVSPAYEGIATNAHWTDALCAHHLREVGIFAAIWGLNQDGLLPRSLKAITNSWGQPLFGWPDSLFCRADTNRVPPESWSAVNFDNTSYEILPGDGLRPFEIYCRCRVHGYYLTADGMVMLKPVFVGIEPAGAGSVEVRFRPFAGRENMLESSDDMANWSAVSSCGPEADEIRFSDSITKTQRFYRLRLK